MTLQSQYKRFLFENPESTFTFEEWKIWFGSKLKDSFSKLLEKQNNENKVRHDLTNETTI